MKKKILVPVILLAAIMLISMIYIKSSYKTIAEIGAFQIDDITKISFQYDNPGNKGGTVENKEKINEFMNYMNSCILRKKSVAVQIVGYYQLIVISTGDKEVTRIMTYDDFIDINGTQYVIVKNKLSLEKIDEFIKSIVGS